MKRILVTGGSGLVGKSLQQIMKDAIYISSKDYDLTDIQQVEQMYLDHKPTHVIHLAARVGGIMENIKYPCDFFEQNISMNTNVICMARKYNVTRLLTMISSCAYPDKVLQYPMSEDMLFAGPAQKSNFSYALSKRSLVAQIEASNEQYKTNYNYLIPCNLYGEHDDYTDVEKMHFVTALIEKIKTSITENKDHIKLFGTGTPLRQFMHSDDLAKVIKYVIDNDITDSFNVAPPNQNLSINEMAILAMEALDINLDIQYDTTKPDGQFNKEICTKKLTTIMPNFKFTSFKDGVLQTTKNK